MASNRYFTKTFNVTTFDKYPLQEKITHLLSKASSGDSLTIKSALIELNIAPSAIEYTFLKNAKTIGGKTIFHAILQNIQLNNFEKYDLAKYLIDNGAPYDIGNDQNERPLHLAAKQQNYELVKLLLTCKANSNSRDSSGLTPLHYALQPEKKECIESNALSDIFGGTKPRIKINFTKFKNIIYNLIQDIDFITVIAVLQDIFALKDIYEKTIKSNQTLYSILENISDKRDYALKHFRLKFGIIEAIKSYLTVPLSPASLFLDTENPHNIPRNAYNADMIIPDYIANFDINVITSGIEAHHRPLLYKYFNEIPNHITSMLEHITLLRTFSDGIKNFFDIVNNSHHVIRHLQLFYKKFMDDDKLSHLFIYIKEDDDALNRFIKLSDEIINYTNANDYPKYLYEDPPAAKPQTPFHHYLAMYISDYISELYDSLVICARYMGKINKVAQENQPWQTFNDPILINVFITIHYIALQIAIFCKEIHSKMEQMKDYLEQYDKIMEIAAKLNANLHIVMPFFFAIIDDPNFKRDRYRGMHQPKLDLRNNLLAQKLRSAAYYVEAPNGNINEIICKITEHTRQPPRYIIEWSTTSNITSPYNGSYYNAQQFFEEKYIFNQLNKFEKDSSLSSIYGICSGIIKSINDMFVSLNKLNEQMLSKQLFELLTHNGNNYLQHPFTTNLPLPSPLPVFSEFVVGTNADIRQLYLLKMSKANKIYVHNLPQLIAANDPPFWLKSYGIANQVLTPRDALDPMVSPTGDDGYAILCYPKNFVGKINAAHTTHLLCGLHGAGGFDITQCTKYGNAIGFNNTPFNINQNDPAILFIFDTFVDGIKHVLMNKTMEYILTYPALSGEKLARLNEFRNEFLAQKTELIQKTFNDPNIDTKIKKVIWKNVCSIIDEIIIETLHSLIETGTANYLERANSDIIGSLMPNPATKPLDQVLINPAKSDKTEALYETINTLLADGKFSQLGFLGYGKFLPEKIQQQCILYNIQNITKDYCYNDIDERIILTLVKHGADVNSADNAKTTPLIMAIQMRKINIVSILLQNGAQPLHAFKKCYEMITDLVNISPFRRTTDITSNIVLRLQTQTKSNYVPSNINYIIPVALYLLDHQITAFMGTYPNSWSFRLHNKLHKLFDLNFSRNTRIPLITMYAYDPSSLHSANYAAFIKKKEENDTNHLAIQQSIDALTLQKHNLELEYEVGHDPRIHQMIRKIDNEINKLVAQLVPTAVRPDIESGLKQDNSVYQLHLQYALHNLNIETNVIKIYETLFTELNKVEQQLMGSNIPTHNVYSQMWEGLIEKKTYRDSTQIAHAIYDFIEKNKRILASAYKTAFIPINSVFKTVYSDYSQRYFDAPENLDTTNSHNIPNQLFNIMVHVVRHLIMPYFIGAVSQKIYDDNTHKTRGDVVSWTYNTIKQTKFDEICIDVLPPKLVKIVCKLADGEDDKDKEADIYTLLIETVELLQTKGHMYITSNTLENIKNTIVVYFKEYLESMIREMYKALVIQLKIFLDQARLLEIAMLLSNAIR